MKIGFIGVGNMAGAIIKGLLKNGTDGQDVLVHSAHQSNYETFAKKFGVRAVQSNLEIARDSDMIVLAVKPYVIGTVIDEVKAVIKDDQLVVSIASGVSVGDIEQLIGRHVPILRTMPNVNVEIGEGMTAVNGNGPLDENPFKKGVTLFETIGKTMEVEEKDFPIFSAIAGSAPAYAYLFIDALSRAGVKYGLSKAESTAIAAQMVKGSAEMVLKSSEVPYALIDKVSSPGGTTVAGLLAMEEAGFSTAVVKGIDATVGKEIGK
ncbi:pyrroline-5-carboxylate reductase [Pediococcus stilesii]|uniref:Pyrroline-5-carboxylate reductase n=1 Tax=Pediococcus stilesii TaxID=331679 RepID=A0A5R9BTN2_9LACO|nr:pyrroline-5-carboxylate reductase [Pediococcus stilesii]TLQ03967.1 pyrroline-5-carboxylate reductase [Pediococcus stilesii]